MMEFQPDVAHGDSEMKTFSVASFATRFVLVLVISALGLFTAYYLMKHRPRARKKHSHREILVRVLILESINHDSTVFTMGTVIPSQQVDILPQISGKIQKVSPALVPGAFLKRGEKIIQINPVDEKRNLKQAQASLRIAKAKLARVQQELAIAKKKLPLSRQEVNIALEAAKARDLEVQRKFRRVTSLAKGNLSSRENYDIAKSAAIQATSSLGKAKINFSLIETQEMALELKSQDVQLAKFQLELSRVGLSNAQQRLNYTQISSPFDAVVMDKYIGKGTVVSQATRLATIVATDEYWIKVAIPQDRLPWIKIPKNKQTKGSQAKIYSLSWEKGRYRKGYVMSCFPMIESQGKMAKLLVTVDDPLAQKKEHANLPPLLLNAFLRVEIKGRKLKNVVRIPRYCVQDNNFVWLLKKNKIHRHYLTVVWQDKSALYVNSTLAGKKIVISNIPGAIEGMRVEEMRP